ncbi:GAF sensor signal transduction histidine kinase [Xenorhabdus vietnamensis]|uniref:histidine kinase n=1 Tax=Xenorhabdus vietnamensis TaxID=351656 RepID=A0A1Y2SC95_9GAMM|nr:ATP-binding protein [Xenorhabdus vietnamensis]OTA16234.1 GAF sensor signal transduction histidine kinase [Xenorhabdus vietnamensis]
MKTFSDNPVATTGWLCSTAIAINLFVLLFLGFNTPLTLIEKLWVIFNSLNIIYLFILLHKAEMFSFRITLFPSRDQRKIAILKQEKQYLHFLISLHSQLNLNTSLSDNFHMVFYRLNQLIPLSEVRIILYHPPRKYCFEYPNHILNTQLPRMMKWDLDDKHTFHGMVQILIHQDQALSSYERNFIQSVIDALAKYLSLKNMMRRQIQQSILDDRKAISRDLHDTVAQSFLFLKIQINSLHFRTDKFSRKGLISLRIVKEELEIASQKLREMLLSLRTEKNHYDLHDSLKFLIKEFNHRLGFNIEFHYRITHQIISISHSRHLVQIIREALNNCYKHASASWISIRIYPVGKKIITVISDNGRGIPQTLTEREQFGLAIMRERVSLISGQMKIKKHKKNGTEIEIQFRLQEDKSYEVKD